MSDLKERLANRAARYSDTMGLTREGAIRRIGVMHDDILDALATITELEAKLVKAREALEQIANKIKTGHQRGDASDIREIALAALKELAS